METIKEHKQALFKRLKSFSLAEMTSNGNGKTSGSGTMGVLVVLVGCVGFLIGVISFTFSNEPKADIMIYSTGVITIGTGLLGYRKSKDKIDLKDDEALNGSPKGSIKSDEGIN